MNVSLKNMDATAGILKLEVVKSDYEAQVEKSLKNFRQKANVPGFRKGMVPMGMIRKMYGKHAAAEEINKLVSENLYKYIHENKLNVLGEPMPNESEQKELNFDTQEDFEFCFDIALAPEIKVSLSKEDTLPYYKVAIDEKMVNDQVEQYRANFGDYGTANDVVEKDLVKGTLVELENGVAKENGITVEDAVLMPMYLKNEEEKAKFLQAKLNETVTFDPKKAYDSAEAEIASLLKIDKETVATLNGEFSFYIKEITRHTPAEINQAFFDKVFGENVVTTEEDFYNKIRENIAQQFEPQSNYKFLLDSRELLIAKVGSLQFAEPILKRWLLATNEKTTEEKLNEEFPQILQDLTYQLIKEQLVKDNDIKVEQDDIDAFAKRVAKAQFAQYGMMNVPDDAVANYAKEMLNKKETLRNIIDRAVEEKLADSMKEQVTLDTKEVSTEEFEKLFQ